MFFFFFRIKIRSACHSYNYILIYFHVCNKFPRRLCSNDDEDDAHTSLLCDIISQNINLLRVQSDILNLIRILIPPIEFRFRV